MMKHTQIRLAAFCLFACMVQSPRPAVGEELPVWVTAQKEQVSLKKAPLPSYLEITQSATVVRPKALTRAEDLGKLNPGLTQVLPGLQDLLGKATVSPRFNQLYDAKIESVKAGNFMPARSFFDCATVLDVIDAKSGRHAVLFQSDMDTDTDGTDPVRLSQLKDYDDARLSRSFQPLLAYSWNKTEGEASNPFLNYFDDTLGQLRSLQKQVDQLARADHAAIWEDTKKLFDDQIAALDRRAKYFRKDLLWRRSLIASLDPFIVVPKTWVNQQMAVGDFAAVVHAGKAYPCIIGDTGPTAKTGEASQRLARALNPNASGRVSAVTTVSVTYIVFPGTRSGKGVPDLASYETEVMRLLGEIGGLGDGVKLHAWEQKRGAEAKSAP